MIASGPSLAIVKIFATQPLCLPNRLHSRRPYSPIPDDDGTAKKDGGCCDDAVEHIRRRTAWTQMHGIYNVGYKHGLFENVLGIGEGGFQPAVLHAAV